MTLILSHFGQSIPGSAAESRVETEYPDSELFAAAPHVFQHHGQSRIALARGTVHIPIIALVLHLDDARERIEISVDY
jgi:hypothetical protein